MNFAELMEQVESHIAEGGEIVLTRPGATYSAVSAPRNTYAIIGEDGNGPTFNQGAVGLGQLLWLMEQRAPLPQWEAVAGS